MARQVPWLAGLMKLPVPCVAKVAIRRQASWLVKKASVVFDPRWPFVLLILFADDGQRQC